MRISDWSSDVCSSDLATSIEIDITPFEIDDLAASATGEGDLPNDVDRWAELIDLPGAFQHTAENSILAIVEPSRTDIVFGTFDAMRGVAVDDAELYGLSKYAANNSAGPRSEERSEGKERG